MENVLFVSTSTISLQEYSQAIVAAGGTVAVGGDPLNGTVESDSGVVFTSLFEDFEELGVEFEPEDLDELTTRLGGAPASAIDLHIGHAPGSDELAARIGQGFVDRWGGLIEPG